jgi:hypothetical protein
MKHAHSADVNIEVDLPTQDFEDLIDRVTASAVVVIGFYMAADTARAIIKSQLK